MFNKGILKNALGTLKKKCAQAPKFKISWVSVNICKVPNNIKSLYIKIQGNK